jgi:hypothetical protein
LTQTVDYQSTDRKTNGEVTKLQQFLYNAKYLSIKPDGLFGLSSVSALKKYQYKSLIADVGYLDARTKKRIQSDTCSAADMAALTKATDDAKKAQQLSNAKAGYGAKPETSGTFKVTTTIVEMRDSKGNVIKKTVSSAADGDKAAKNGMKISSSKSTTTPEIVVLSSEKLNPKAPFKVIYPQGYEKIEPLKSYGIQWSAPSVSIKSSVRLALVNVKKDEVSKFDEGSLVDPSILDISSLSPDARVISAGMSGIPKTVPNRGGYTWSVPSGLTPGTGYRIFVGNAKTGVGTLSEANFWITSQTPKITKTRVSKLPTGYLINISGVNFTSGLSARFTINGRTLLDVDSQWVQVIGTSQVQFLVRTEDMTDIPIGGVYSITLYDGTTEIETEPADIAFWQ